MQKAARHSIPRGFHPTYTPCLDEEYQDLLKQYEESGDPDIADHLIESLNVAHQHRWEELTLKMNFMHSRQKSWALDMPAWCCSTTIQVNSSVSQRQRRCHASHPGN